MGIPEDDLKIIRAEAAAVAKIIARAEAKAQAKLQAIEKAQGLTDAINKVLARHIDEETGSFNKIAEQVNRLSVMVDVLVDLLIDDKPMRAEGLPANKRAKFHALCKTKADGYGVREVAPGVKP